MHSRLSSLSRIGLYAVALVSALRHLREQHSSGKSGCFSDDANNLQGQQTPVSENYE